MCIEKKKEAEPLSTEEKLKMKILETLAEYGKLSESGLFDLIRKNKSPKNLKILRDLVDQQLISKDAAGHYHHYSNG